MDRVRVLLLGLGGINVWSRRTDASIVGAVNLYDEEPIPPARAVLDHARLYTDIETALKDSVPDLVMMCTPNYRKTDMRAAAAVVNAGHHLYLDKLRCAQASAGEELLHLRQQSGRRILVGDHYRFHPAVVETRRLLAAGMAGNIELVVWECYRPEVPAQWKTAYRHLMLEDLSFHHFSALQAMIGLPFDTVYALSTVPRRSSQNARTAVSVVAHQNHGIQLCYQASWSACGDTTAHFGEFRLEGSRGSIVFRSGRLCCRSASGEEGGSVPTAPIDGPQVLIDHYLDVCNRQIPSELDIERFLPVVRLLYACVRSAETGSPVGLSSASQQAQG